ncbi:unnamed protein product [Symbiodinium sp. KB8]|nr:unnamed protein product [Symbiodinium sp. KB8]
MASLTPQAQQLYLITTLHKDGLLTGRAKALLKGLVLRGDRELEQVVTKTAMLSFQDSADALFKHAGAFRGWPAVRCLAKACVVMPATHAARHCLPLLPCTVGVARGLFDSIYEDVGQSASELARGAPSSPTASSASGVVEMTYAEMAFEAFAEVMRGVHPTPGSRFLDLGSGTGRQVMAAALLFDFAGCVGVEMHHALNSVAQQRPARAQAAVARAGGLPEDLPDMHFIENDFMHISWRDYDVVFANAADFPPSILQGIADQSRELPKGALLITCGYALTAGHLTCISSKTLPAEWGGMQASQAPGNAGGYRVRVPSFASNDSAGLHDVDREAVDALDAALAGVPLATPARPVPAGSHTSARLEGDYGGASSPQADALLAARRSREAAQLRGAHARGGALADRQTSTGSDSSTASGHFVLGAVPDGGIAGRDELISSPQGVALRRARNAAKRTGPLGGGALRTPPSGPMSPLLGSGPAPLAEGAYGIPGAELPSSPQGRALLQARPGKRTTGPLVDETPPSPHTSPGLGPTLGPARSASRDGQGSALSRRALIASSGVRGGGDGQSGWPSSSRALEDGSASPQGDALLKRKARAPAPRGEVHTPTLTGQADLDFEVAGSPRTGSAGSGGSGGHFTLSPPAAVMAPPAPSAGGGPTRRHASLRTRTSDADQAFLSMEELG